MELEWTFFESSGLFNASHPLPSKLLTQSPHRNGQVWVLSPYPWTQEYSIDQQCQRSHPTKNIIFHGLAEPGGSGVDIKWHGLRTKEVILSTPTDSSCVAGTLFPSPNFFSFIMDDMAWEHIYYEDVQGYVDENGVSNIEEFFKNKLEGWRDVEVNIAISGSSGAGKSSFINAIRE